MAEKKIASDYKNIYKKNYNDGLLCENDIVSKSPRYTRKKRISTSQARRYHSQLSARGKITNNKFKFSEESLNDVLVQHPIVNDYILPKESHSFSDCIQNKESYGCCSKNDNSIILNCEVNRTLKYSHSFPSINCRSIVNLTHSKSCDFLYTSQNIFSVLSDRTFYKGSFEQFDNKPTDSSSLTGSVIENASVVNSSRRSSISTVRERNNSQDSAFSQISIIDIKEAEEAAQELTVNTWKPHHSRSRSDASSDLYKSENLDGNEVLSLPSSFSSISDTQINRKKSIFEGQQITVPTECFFPRPHQGQSLTSFLSSTDFNISAELDRENAHFCISDALISAIEHMKCSRTLRAVEDDDESDEEIRKLTQRIRIRRRERQREKVLKSIVLLSDGKTDTTSQSASPPVSSHSSDFDVDSLCSEDEVEDLELSAHTDSNLSSMKENGLSLSMASLYSDADIHKGQMFQKELENKKLQESDSVNLTAESVALSLLRKFSEKHLPKASELQWLVSEQDAPQRLLPLPDSWPISPDVIEEEYNLAKMRLRGNLEWAPPRPQIIFIMHPYMKRKEIIERQKYRCAGCGMKIEKGYVSRFRYCDYFGKYFCQCCHNNSLALIPGRILWKWDFSKYYVSKFAWNLLDQMFLDPLFSIEDINNNLYQKVRQLDSCRFYRMQLFYLKDFIRTCRKAELIQGLLEKQNHHIIYEPHMYSLSDLAQVKSGELSKHLSQLVSYCLDHVKQCILCQAKGFICEICQKEKDIIFPFQFDKVILCQNCGSCFHKRCCKNIKCPRCIRIQERKKRIAAYKSDDEL